MVAAPPVRPHRLTLNFPPIGVSHCSAMAELTGVPARGMAEIDSDRRLETDPKPDAEADAGRQESARQQALDQELVRRVQRGDTSAFDALVRKYQHRIVGLIGRYVADWSECQDIAQETFIRAYRAMGNFRGDSQFYTWLHRIAVNTAKNHLVAQNRRPPTDDIEVGDAEQYDTAIRLRDNDTPERELMRQQVEQTVVRVVADLPQELRDAISLREVDGLSYEEIAQRMDCPIGTVRSRIFRARDAIDAQLKPLLGDTGDGAGQHTS